MLIRKINFILLTSLVIVFLIVNPINLDAQQNVYQPYPIIFIHGINSKMATWDYSKNELEIYFKEGVNYKYQQEDQKKYNRQNYFPNCDYQYMNNGDIKAITFELKESIDNAIKSFSTAVPDDERKVIIVAHSMGGLVTRALLKYDEKGFAGKEKDYYKSKIDKIIFIGTPHLGTPIASVLWIYNKVTEEDLPALLDDNVNFYSQTTLTPFKFQQISPSTSNFDNRRMAILAEEQKIAKILRVPRIFGPYPDGIALEQLRLAGDVSCSYYIDSYGIEPIPIIKSITGTNTFLGKTPSDLATPPHSVFKVIRGKNTEGLNISSWAIDKVIGKYENDFVFPIFNQETQSLTECASGENRGDGIVTKASQDGIGLADYTINAFHTNETNAWEPILQAIDDAPVIESAYFVKSYPTSYIVIKVKDYLLADIEIANMTVDGQAVDLNEFKDDVTLTYKPYVKFKKDFLKERTVTLSGQKLNFKPGEFYVPITIPYGPNSHTIYFKFKNPAGKEAEAALYLTAITYIIKEAFGEPNPGSGPGFSQDFWEELRETIYIVFCNASKEVNQTSLYSYLGVGREAWISGGSYYVDYPYQAYFWMWGAYINMTYSSWLNFDLNLADKNIKSAKFIYNFYKDFEGTNQNFDVLISHDSSNTWPPILTSSGDTLLFKLNTSTLPSMGQQKIELQKTIDISLEHINPSGYNVWQIRPNLAFPEDNYIPTPIFYGDYAEADFSQTMRIPYYPSLFITFEEKH